MRTPHPCSLADSGGPPNLDGLRQNWILEKELVIHGLGVICEHGQVPRVCEAVARKDGEPAILDLRMQLAAPVEGLT
eukprot:6369666-Amphidinium_carterae.1